jgi:hypothetical protein
VCAYGCIGLTSLLCHVLCYATILSQTFVRGGVTVAVTLGVGGGANGNVSVPRRCKSCVASKALLSTPIFLLGYVGGVDVSHPPSQYLEIPAEAGGSIMLEDGGAVCCATCL